MVPQLFFSFVICLTTYFIGSYLTVAKKFISDIRRQKISSKPRTADIGLWGSLKFGWEARTILWDKVPSYDRALDVLQQHSSRIARVFFLTNWKSAGRLVLCSDLQTIREAFRSSKWLNRIHNDHYIYLGSFGKPLGILLGNGPYWKTARKIVVTAFRDNRIMEVSRVEELFSEEIHLVLNGLRDRLKESTPDHATFSPNHIFDEATLNVAFKILFSRKFSKTDPLERGLPELINYNNDIFSVGMCAIDFFPFLRYFPKLVPSIRENIKFCNLIYDIVANERQRRTNANSEYNDLMDSFLKEVEAHKGSNPNYFTFESLQTTIRDLILAGSDTIHVTLEHLILFMATNRADQKRVQDEIDRVIGPDRAPTYEDRKSMIYTQAVLQETWRLGSVTPITFRMNSEDCELGGMDMKKGTYLIPLYLGVNHSKDIWEDPMVFNPNRFISETGQITNTDKTLIFSYGPRACPGELVGRVAVFLFTVALLREFEWELSDMHPPPSPQCHGGMTRAPAEYFVKIRRRFNPL